MGDRTKRIFISDIHMGDERSMTAPHPYAWFGKNIASLEKFLVEQLQAPDVKEVVVLGDLFDEWIIPTDYAPLTSFESMCSNDANKKVIDNLKALAADIRLVYVPGNHDMAMDITGIPAIKQFMENTFPGIRFICDNNRPLGKYEDGILVAEHGNRYCLFNAPDTWTNPASFLPLGYFISRIVAYQVSKTGQDETPRQIVSKFLKDYIWHPNFVEEAFTAIYQDPDAPLTTESIIQLDDIPGYEGTLTVGDIKDRFRSLHSNWEKAPESKQIDLDMAVINERDTLYEAAQFTYFNVGPHIKVVIFGHTHDPIMKKIPCADGVQSFDADPNACWTIYANSGTWVDSAGVGGTYVETEEVQVKDEKRLYVRVKGYPGNAIIKDYEGFVKL